MQTQTHCSAHYNADQLGHALASLKSMLLCPPSRLQCSKAALFCVLRAEQWTHAVASLLEGQRQGHVLSQGVCGKPVHHLPRVGTDDEVGACAADHVPAIQSCRAQGPSSAHHVQTSFDQTPGRITPSGPAFFPCCEGLRQSNTISTDTLQSHLQLAMRLGATLLAGLARWSPTTKSKWHSSKKHDALAVSAGQCLTALESFTASTQPHRPSQNQVSDLVICGPIQAPERCSRWACPCTANPKH